MDLSSGACCPGPSAFSRRPTGSCRSARRPASGGMTGGSRSGALTSEVRTSPGTGSSWIESSSSHKEVAARTTPDYPPLRARLALARGRLGLDRGRLVLDEAGDEEQRGGEVDTADDGPALRVGYR